MASIKLPFCLSSNENYYDDPEVEFFHIYNESYQALIVKTKKIKLIENIWNIKSDNIKDYLVKNYGAVNIYRTFDQKSYFFSFLHKKNSKAFSEVMNKENSLMEGKDLKNINAKLNKNKILNYLA